MYDNVESYMKYLLARKPKIKKLYKKKRIRGSQAQRDLTVGKTVETF